MNDTQRHTSHFYDVHFFTLKHFDTLLAFFFFFSILFYTLQRSECRQDEQQNGQQTKTPSDRYRSEIPGVPRVFGIGRSLFDIFTVK